MILWSNRVAEWPWGPMGGLERGLELQVLVGDFISAAGVPPSCYPVPKRCAARQSQPSSIKIVNGVGNPTLSVGSPPQQVRLPVSPMHAHANLPPRLKPLLVSGGS